MRRNKEKAHEYRAGAEQDGVGFLKLANATNPPRQAISYDERDVPARINSIAGCVLSVLFICRGFRLMNVRF